jgi:hypothetical protein
MFSIPAGPAPVRTLRRHFLNPFVIKSHTKVTFLRIGNDDMKGRGRMLLLWLGKLSV